LSLYCSASSASLVCSFFSCCSSVDIIVVFYCFCCCYRLYGSRQACSARSPCYQWKSTFERLENPKLRWMIFYLNWLWFSHVKFSTNHSLQLSLYHCYLHMYIPVFTAGTNCKLLLTPTYLHYRITYVNNVYFYTGCSVYSYTNHKLHSPIVCPETITEILFYYTEWPLFNTWLLC